MTNPSLPPIAVRPPSVVVCSLEHPLLHEKLQVRGGISQWVGRIGKLELSVIMSLENCRWVGGFSYWISVECSYISNMRELLNRWKKESEKLQVRGGFQSFDMVKILFVSAIETSYQWALTIISTRNYRSGVSTYLDRIGNPEPPVIPISVALFKNNLFLSCWRFEHLNLQVRVGLQWLDMVVILVVPSIFSPYHPLICIKHLTVENLEVQTRENCRRERGFTHWISLE